MDVLTPLHSPRISPIVGAGQLTFAWMLLWTATVGCRPQADGPLTFPVTGVVTKGGQPVAEAIVQFTPTSLDLGVAGAQVRTDANGAFDVHIELNMGQESQRGLPAGEYRVAVTKLETGPGAPSLDNPPRNVLPVKYAMAEKSPLKATVTADGENVFNFEL